MKLKFLTLALLLFSIFSSAQEVKVKRCEIQLDGKSIAKIDKDKYTYTISDLSGKALFTAKITDKTPLNNTAPKSWLELTGANGVVREVEMRKSGGFSIGFEKPIIENLTLANNPLLPATGIDESRINAFFQTEDRQISKEADRQIEQDKKIARSEDSLASANKLMVDRVGFINANGQKIGYLMRRITGKDITGEYLSYDILDINKISVAKINFSTTPGETERTGYLLNVYDGKTFPIKSAYTSSRIEEDKLATRIIRKLYANGYTLGDMKSATQIAAQENADAYNDERKANENNAKSQSKNLYDLAGYVIDKSGTKKEGKITVEFESINAILGREKNVADLTSYGSTVKISADGKDDYLKAKDGVKFCAGDRCFLGVQGTEDSGTGNSSGSQLGAFGESLFFEILAENNGNYVLNYVKNPQYFYLKLANQAKAIYLGDKAGFGTKKPEKIKKIFDAYVNCPAMEFSKYDTKTKEGLVRFLADYTAGCKK